jgi:two-component system, chemotaxis family, protein-glutamate methylesterase/glutaminase
VNSSTGEVDIVAIGASAGGFDALCRVTSRLGGDFSIPIAVVQHRAKNSQALASLLQPYTSLRVLDVEDKQPMEPATIYIAPPDYHMLAEEGAFALSTEGPVGYSRPSIDVFFESVADVYGPAAIGVILTGANADGSNGLRRIAQRGGEALVQDPATAEVAAMPAAAQRLVERARTMTLEEIAAYLVACDHRQRRTDRSNGP